MDASFGHPIWISSGVLLIVIGFIMFRWARRNDAMDEVNLAAREAAVQKLLKTPGAKPPGTSKKRATANFRHAMSQFFGIVGFLLIIAGIVAAIFGVFYEGS